MKILLIGKNGWIGQQVLDILKKLGHEIILPNEDFRADNIKSIEEILDSDEFTHVMSFIGRTHGKIGDKVFSTIDYLEQEGKLTENIRDNLFAPIILAESCKKRNIHFTYLGTGCIFKFDEDHPFEKEENGFTEDSEPNFFDSSYSVVKGYTDRLMHMYPDTVLNVRIRMPITSDTKSRNFITKITNYKKICSIKNSMTVLPELLPLMVELAEKKVTGTINLTNPGLISHNEILEMYKEIVDPEFTWENFSIEEQKIILDAGRSNNYLDTCKLESYFPQVKNIKDSVKEILKVMKDNS